MHKIFKYTKHPCLKIWANDPWERQCPVLSKSRVFLKTQLDSKVPRRSHLIPAPVGGSPGLINYWTQQSAKASPSSALHPQVQETKAHESHEEGRLRGSGG